MKQSMMKKTTYNLINIPAKIEKLKKQKKAINDEIKALQKAENEAKTLIIKEMENAMQREIITDVAKLRLVPNPPKVKIIDESAIPEAYKSSKTVINIDKKKIMKEFKDNNIEVSGTEITRNNRLKIDFIY